MKLKEIIPFVGLGDLHFGTPRSTVRAALDSEYQSFKKTYNSRNLTDAYDTLGFHLYYDADDRLEFIETFPPCNPTYNGIRLLRGGRKRILQQLADIGYTADYENEGYNFETLGFVLYVPYRKIEAVSLYPRGYYDR